MARVGFDLIRCADEFEQPDDAQGAGLCQYMQGNHSVFLGVWYVHYDDNSQTGFSDDPLGFGGRLKT